jgi:hypothetical protein
LIKSVAEIASGGGCGVIAAVVTGEDESPAEASEAITL